MMKKQQGMVEEDDMNISSDELSENNSTDNEADDGNESQDDEKQSEDKMLLEVTYREEWAMEQLSAVFELLKMEPIHDK